MHGQSKQSPYSDMYSIGKVFKVLAERGCFADLSDRDAQDLDSLIDSLTSVLWHAKTNGWRLFERNGELF